MSRLRLVWLLVAGCGRIAFDPAGADASGGDGPAAACATWSPFAGLVPVANVNDVDENDSDPFITEDGIELFFASNRTPGMGLRDLWRADRPDTGVPFRAPVPVVELSTTGDEGGPSLTADGLTIVFDRDADLWTATRPDRDTPFGTPSPITELNSMFRERAGTIARNGLALYFESAVGSTIDLYIATRPNLSSPFDPAVALAVVNSGDWDDHPDVTADEQSIVFVSDRAGGSGGFDLYLASRGDAAAPFGTPRNLTELNTAGDDLSPQLSPDHGRIYFSQPNGANLDIVTAVRTCLDP